MDFANLFLVVEAGETAGPYLTLAESQEAGAVTIGYGGSVNGIVAFTIVTFAVFMLVRSLKRRQEEQAAPAEPPGPTTEELLAEIRDTLKARGGAPGRPVRISNRAGRPWGSSAAVGK